MSIIIDSIYLKRFKDFIKKSNLSTEDKKSLIDFFSKASDDELENTLSLFIENPYWISVINENVKLKKDALEDKSEEKWNAIVAAEKVMLQNL